MVPAGESLHINKLAEHTHTFSYGMVCTGHRHGEIPGKESLKEGGFKEGLETGERVHQGSAPA